MATSPTIRSRKPQHGMARALHNLLRFPARTVRTVGLLLDPNYRLEREAFRAVGQWMSRERRKQLEAVPGMSSTHECRLLAHLASMSPAGGDIVEIGAWKGKSTAWLVEGAQRQSHRPAIVSIDPHERQSWDDFSSTVRRFDLVGRGLTIHRAASHDVGRTWSRPIGLLWVDGCHEYEAVVRDIADFVPHVMPGGWVVFDDAAGGVFPGVEQAISEGMTPRGAFARLATIRHLQVFRRRT